MSIWFESVKKINSSEKVSSGDSIGHKGQNEICICLFLLICICSSLSNVFKYSIMIVIMTYTRRPGRTIVWIFLSPGIALVKMKWWIMFQRPSAYNNNNQKRDPAVRLGQVATTTRGFPDLAFGKHARNNNRPSPLWIWLINLISNSGAVVTKAVPSWCTCHWQFSTKTGRKKKKSNKIFRLYTLI